jgi:hypothetical protein
MTHQTLQIVVKQMQSPNFVCPISDYSIGRAMYRNAYGIEECTTDEMTVGWLDAEKSGMMAYYGEMMKAAKQ